MRVGTLDAFRVNVGVGGTLRRALPTDGSVSDAQRCSFWQLADVKNTPRARNPNFKITPKRGEARDKIQVLLRGSARFKDFGGQIAREPAAHNMCTTADNKRENKEVKGGVQQQSFAKSVNSGARQKQNEVWLRSERRDFDLFIDLSIYLSM